MGGRGSQLVNFGQPEATEGASRGGGGGGGPLREVGQGEPALVLGRRGDEDGLPCVSSPLNLETSSHVG